MIPTSDLFSDPTARRRFFAKVQCCPVSGCWFWEGATNPKGYGVFRFNGTARLAHRVSYFLHGGKAGPNEIVLHTCDMPACVNPEHLTAGSPLKNTADMIAKGRMATRLKESAVVRLLIRHLSGEKIHCFRAGEEIGVSNVTIWKIITGQSWKQLPRNKEKLMEMVK